VPEPRLVAEREKKRRFALRGTSATERGPEEMRKGSERGRGASLSLERSLEEGAPEDKGKRSRLPKRDLAPSCGREGRRLERRR